MPVSESVFWSDNQGVAVGVALAGSMVTRMASSSPVWELRVAFTCTVSPTLRSLSDALPVEVLYFVVAVSVMVTGFFPFAGITTIDWPLID